MKNKKKLTKNLTKVFALAMAFSLVFAAGCNKADKKEEKAHQAFIDTLGGCSDTYKGAISNHSYNSQADAAEGFIEVELTGNEDVVITNTQSQGTLSGEEVAALAISDADREGIQEVEKLSVTYTKESISSVAKTADTLDTSRTVDIYIIKYPNNFKYYSPAPITGETVTKSYYDSIFDSEKYANCTLTYTTKIEAVVKVMKIQLYSYTYELNQTIKYANDKIYLEQRISQQSEGAVETGNMGLVTDPYLAAYIEVVDGQNVCYVKTSEESTSWNKGNLHQIGFNHIEELRPFYGQFLDYTYFTKTDYGCALAEENAKKYVNETLSNDQTVSQYLDDMTIDMFAKYYVANGVLSGVRQDINLTLDMKVEGLSTSVDEVVVSEMKCTDYGTTVVEKPFN